ncbi:unnamed protein product [Rhizoctonia solani]|uniref:Uncharacterized protein n=1 Tax=Rhizoctonia solani TaxID=456999 RepID=A0A8H3C610_9AGAM|nr:unnamed protein product [Rhizoctonia solani]
MSLSEGVYLIRSLGSDNSFVGVGPIPLIYPPPPAPLRCTPATMRDPIGLKPADGKYILEHKGIRYAIGSDEEGRVKLISGGGGGIKWTIDRSGEGSFRIKDPDSDRYWTAPKIITLQGENGGPKQEWEFENADDD